MAQRRMFSPDIVESDAFIEMPMTSQALYFHLGMYADDDGFVNPKRVMRMLGAAEDDLKVLLSKRFLLTFENGVVVIKHWRINNLVRKDWYKETQYIEQKNKLKLKENGSYTEFVNENVPSSSTQVRLGKVRLIPTCSSRMSDGDFDTFWKSYPRKVGKIKAEAKFKKLNADLLPMILKSLTEQKQTDQWKKDNGQFIPHPTTWLTQGRWEDELEVKVPLTLEEHATQLVKQYGHDIAQFKFLEKHSEADLLKVKHIINL